MSQNAQCSKVAVKGLELCLDTEGLNIPTPESIREIIREEGVAGGAGIDYSLEEQWTGLRWIDGSKIYQKTILLPDMPPSDIRHPHNIPDLKMVISSEGYGIMSGNNYACIPSVNSDSLGAGITLQIHRDVIYVRTYHSPTYTKNAHITIRYTREEQTN